VSLRTPAIALIAWSATSIALAWLVRMPWIGANLLILGAPLGYLLARSAEVRARLRPSFILRYVVFVVIFFDYLCVRYGGWGGPSSFPLLPGGINVEQVMWTALFIPLVLAMNETFFVSAHAAPQRRYPRAILSAMFFGGLLVALVPMLHPLVAGDVYLKIGLMLYPLVFTLAFLVDRAVWRELVRIAVVFGIFNLAFELLALHVGYWTFQGRYVAMVTVAGYRFPLEELVFLVLLCAPAVVAAYSLYKNWKGLQAAYSAAADRQLHPIAGPTPTRRPPTRAAAAARARRATAARGDAAATSSSDRTGR
jgi:hypothetical protein